MAVDYHMHTPLCKHATGEPEEYALRALERGIAEIGFSDHSPMPSWYDPMSRMTREEFPRYEAMVRDVQRRFEGRLLVRFGVEADYHPGTEEYVREFLGSTSFDYVIGSVHYLGEWPFDKPEAVEGFLQRDIDAIYEEYYGLMARMAETGLYDIAGHFDLPKKFGHRPRSSRLPSVRRALVAIRDAGMCYEVNTSGLRKPVREIYPSADIIRLACDLGVPVTLGSDAHEPLHVGEDFDQALAILRDAGYRQVMRFEGRRRKGMPL